MATDSDVAVLSTQTVVGLVVAASLGAVYAFGYTPLGRLVGSGSGDGSGEPESGSERVRARTTRIQRTATTKGDVDGVLGKEGEESAVPGGKGRRKSKSIGAGAPAVSSTQVIPGDFEGVGADESPQETSKQATSPKFPKKKKKTKKQKQKAKGKEGQDAGSDLDPETGKETDVEHLDVHDPRSGENTDALVSLSPSVSGDALPGSARVMAEGSHKAWPFRPPGLSSDVDVSWTHVDRSHLKTSTSIEGQARAADAVKNSDVISTTSRDANRQQRKSKSTFFLFCDFSLAVWSATFEVVAWFLLCIMSYFLPRASRELSDGPTPARVLRVQPQADETPVPGFSWEDYGDFLESAWSTIADEEDKEEWDVVKSRHRTRPQLATLTSASTATSHAPAAPENMTKKQRQNARKRELANAAKAEAEAARLQGLAKHQRELERLRIIEQSRQGGGKRPSGGMQATVDEHGKLVWE
ncbi:hypothetical protein JVT61DRAFT_3977 [Boletus reticuloceps]|uniref:Uncharacterized protein n=1 Tax=Boletus reticuloceps TaxID=495285 RepID=A0A8I3A986_9AGAM|nr:hypothetical protein JVT61DRAFT_3977 [Boletus reticuloceps]